MVLLAEVLEKLLPQFVAADQLQNPPRAYKFITDSYSLLLRIRATPGLKNAEHRRIRAYSPA
jgi:hypothetical protein